MQVTAFAAKAHGSQKRKYTADLYIVHPVRVMELCREHTADIAVLSAALMHDVLEDTAVSREEIIRFLNGLMSYAKAEKTLRLVVELTDQYIKTAYPALNRRQRKEKELLRMKSISADAQTIKYADIIDNCREIVDHDAGFARVFLEECMQVLKILKKGNGALYRLAFDEVEMGRTSLKKKRLA